MSKERQRARAAREVARQAEVAAAARRRNRQGRRAVLLSRVTPTVPRRRRRYGALPARVWFRLVVAFGVVQALSWWFLPGVGQRLSVAVLTLAVLLVLVRTRRSPAR
jgi:uncharacterized membrane protein YbaN (DUF454 family)